MDDRASTPQAGLISATGRTVAAIVAVFAASRIGMYAFAAWFAAHASLPASVPHGWLGPFCRWDCGWYLGIAAHGYEPIEDAAQPGATNFAFYPVFPLLVRLAAPLFGGELLPAAVAISNACFLAALFLVHRHARAIGASPRAALLTVTLLCVLPHSLAMSSAMSESTFLLLLVAAMYALQQQCYFSAGAAAALLSATRAPGILFALCALLSAWRHGGWRALVAPWRSPERHLPVVLAPMGLFAFWTYCFFSTGDAFAQASTARHGWAWTFLLPWQSLPLLFQSGGASALMALGGLAMLAGSALLVIQGQIEEALFCVAAVLLVLCGLGAASVFRYWIVLFPLWLAFARWLAPRPIAATTVLLLAIVANLLMVSAWINQSPLAI